MEALALARWDAACSFAAALFAVSLVPAILSGSILKKYARQEGAGGLDWIPFGLLPYALTRFQHKSKFAIVWAYVFFNLVSLAAIVVLVILLRRS